MEVIDEGSFVEMKNLNYLSLAGNFLKEFTFGPKLWEGVENLQFLDIGWNEMSRISDQFLKNVDKSVKALDLSHNEKLQKVRLNFLENNISSMRGS